MKRLAIKIGILSLLLITANILLIIAPMPANDSFHVLVAKHQILKRTKTKKIILVGGSGVLYGLSAKLLKQEFPDYDVINMGFNGGLGLQFNLNEIKPYLAQGDVVLLSPEYENFIIGCSGIGTTLLKTLNVFPQSINYISRKQVLSILTSDTLNFLQFKAQSYLESLVLIATGNSLTINEYGDIISTNVSRDVNNVSFNPEINITNYDKCCRLLADFQCYCNSRGVLALFTFPSIPRPQYEEGRNTIEYIYDRLKKDAPVLILHAPIITVFDPKYFEDNIYHLNSLGREQRTATIASLLKELL